MSSDGRSGRLITASATSDPPLKHELKPIVGRKLRFVFKPDRRRSPSTSRTRRCVCAKTIAQLILVVVLPSPETELVTTIVLGGAPGADSRRLVRSPRYASANCDSGWSSTLNFLAPFK